MPQSRTLDRVSPYLLLTTVVFFWALNWIVGRLLRDEVPPYSLAFWRWLLASLLLLPFAWRHLLSDWRKIRDAWPVMIVLGVSGTSFISYSSFTGLKYTTAVNGAILNSFTPIFIIAISWAFLGQRLHASQWLGAAISLIGVMAIVARGDATVILTLAFNLGDLWIMGSMLLWAIYTICLRWRPPGVHPLAFLTATMIIGVLAMLPPYLWSLAYGAQSNWSPGALIGIAYLGVFPSALAYILWNNAVTRVGPNKAGMFMHLVPLYTSLLAIFILDEQLHLFHFVGMALILAGIWLVSRRGAAELGATPSA